MSKGRHTAVLVGASVVLVFGGTTAMAGVVAAEPPTTPVASSTVAVRSDVPARANRSNADRQARLALARKIASQRHASHVAKLKADALQSPAHKAHQIAVRNAAARKSAARKATSARRTAARKAAAARASRSAIRSVAPSGGSNRRLGQAMAADRGWTGDQWTCLNNLWQKESGWSTQSGSPGGAYGIAQALPGSKMASAGPDWRNDAATQIRWGFGYISGRYGNPCGAWRHWQSHHWY